MWICFAIIAILQVAVWAVLAAMWPRRRPLPAAEGQPAISVIVAARNEMINLQTHLPALLAQSYTGPWELIVVLDRCADGSAQVVADLQLRHPRLRAIHVSELPEGWTGKKNALRTGIEAAVHDHIALTDADCAVPPMWLAGMAAQFTGGAELVLGASPYAPRPGLLNLLVRHETWMTALLYVGLGRMGFPYMGVGRSLGYTRAWYARSGGLAGIAAREGGDDDLLVNRGGRGSRLGWAVGAAEQVISAAPKTWREWLWQKARHGHAGTGYSLGSLAILSTIHGLHLIFYLSLVVVLCVQSAPVWALAIYLGRLVALWGIQATVPWRYKWTVMCALPLLDLLYLVYLILLPATAFIQPKWKR